MPIEILANVTNTPTIIDGLTLSDLAALISSIIAFAALVSSALLFWFGYSRTRKSEQIKIAREIVDRIDVKSRKLKEAFNIFKKERDRIDGYYFEDLKSDEISFFTNKAEDVFTVIYYLLLDIEYFAYLIRMHEIRDEAILKYYIPRIHEEEFSADYYIKLMKSLKIIWKTSKKTSKDLDVYNNSLGSFFDDRCGNLQKQLNQNKDLMKGLFSKYMHLYVEWPITSSS